MNTLDRCAFAAGLFLVASCLATQAQYPERMPQDNWMLHSYLTTNPSGSHAQLAVDTNGDVYVAAGTSCRVLDQTGGVVRSWTPTGSITDMEFGPDGDLYALQAIFGSANLVVYSSQGSPLRSWSVGQFASVGLGLGLAENGDVYVAMDATIKVYNAQGSLLREWGQEGTFPGYLQGAADVAVGPDDLVCVIDQNNLNIFSTNGTFIRRWSDGDRAGVLSGPDGCIWAIRIPNTTPFYPISIFDWYGATIAWLGPSAPGHFDDVYLNFLHVDDVALSPDCQFCYISTRSLNSGTNRVLKLRRGYRSMGAFESNALPLPVVLQCQQRPGTTLLDIDYKIVDPDSLAVNVAALAFNGGVNTLNSIIRLNTLIESTETNLGSALNVGVKRRITWDVGADWNISYGNVKVRILANDGRGLLDSDFITIPASGTNAQLTIDRIAVTDADLLYCWYWLIATNDPAITLTTGTVFGVSGVYSNKVLAQGTTTTTDGLNFLLERLHVRPATAGEIQYANVSPVWTPRNRMGKRPAQVNAYGFDGSAGGLCWVVPLP